jgi:hypothetical protein
VISPRIWFLGVPILAALFFWIPSPMLILIAILALPQLWTAFRDRSVLEAQYYRAPQRVRVEYAVQYLALASFLAIMAFAAYESTARALS